MGELTAPCVFEEGLFPSCCDVMVAWFLAAEFWCADSSDLPLVTPACCKQAFRSQDLDLSDPWTCAPCRFELDMQSKLRPLPRFALERSYPG